MELLSVVIPVYNEERQLEAFILNLLKAPCPCQREFIFVDDCSTDKSLEILDKFQALPNIQILEQPENKGKGAAVSRGIAMSRGNFIMIQDADFEYDPTDVPQLLQPLLQEKADVVYGSRFKKNASQVHRTYHYFVNGFLTFLSNLFSGIYLTDMETCYKIFKADLLQAMNLKSKRFGFEVEVTAYLAKTNARIEELPISYRPRTRLQGKKINWKDGVAALFHLLRFNFFTNLKKAYYHLPVYYDPQSPVRPIVEKIVPTEGKKETPLNQ